jgi:hypothetical protein
MITLCRRCHARVHHTYRIPYGFPDLLASLWAEWFPTAPKQLELRLLPPDAPPPAPTIQTVLFDFSVPNQFPNTETWRDSAGGSGLLVRPAPGGRPQMQAAYLPVPAGMYDQRDTLGEHLIELG